MMNKLQEAFQKSHNSRYSNCSYKTTQNGYFDARTQLDFENYLSGVEFGRKQALEAIEEICERTYPSMREKLIAIKELLK